MNRMVIRKKTTYTMMVFPLFILFLEFFDRLRNVILNKNVVEVITSRWLIIKIIIR